MERESLEKVARMIILHLKDLGINDIDKLELMVNIDNFLNPEEYDDNIKILQKSKRNKKYGRY